MEQLIDAAITLAGRAPSAHNTQPWAVEQEGEKVRLRVDPARTLPLADPTHQDTVLGLGAWVEAFAIALQRELCLQVSGRGAALVVEIQVGPEPYRDFTPREVAARQVDRGRLVKDEVSLHHALENFGLLATTAVAQMMGERTWRKLHNRTALDIARTPEILAETVSWLRLDPTDPAYHRDGLNADCLRISPGLARLGRRLLNSPGLRRTAGVWQPLLARLYYSRSLRPPSRVVLCAGDTTDPAALIECGRDLLRCWLLLARAGLRVSVNSEIKDNPDTAAKLPPGAFAVFSVGVSTTRVPWSSRLQDPGRG
ncbi:Putative NAD(P)H nitroreductase acg [Corynebacterium occultum]|uniref:NAD(P)H nitroreductase acg n=1 Tax=Corynebacterium occultum TaxID=2675219 RepID=A0A6B8W9J7_9CORY|nr:hypothetical protein [Corynebacterium occultum]QGU07945.1 Putative NAD(P)H nitroreductase acg [Corynebacterium occultum]